MLSVFDSISICIHTATLEQLYVVRIITINFGDTLAHELNWIKHIYSKKEEEETKWEKKKKKNQRANQ